MGAALDMMQLSTPRIRSGNTLRMALARTIRDDNIWRVEDQPGGRALPWIRSTRIDTNAQFSPDGAKIALQSNRSGSVEIWVCRSDGSNPMPVTAFGGAQIGGPHWSPDGERLVFHARPEGHADVYVVNIAGGPPRRLTHQTSNDAGPSWSRDGRFVYVESDRGGTKQVWKMPAEGGQPVQVTRHGANVPIVSPDGAWVFYAKETGLETSLWKVPAGGGHESRVLESIVDIRGFFPVEEGIYFLSLGRSGAYLGFCDFAGRRARRIWELSKPASWGVSAWPVARGRPRTILYSQMDQQGSDLMLLEMTR